MTRVLHLLPSVGSGGTEVVAATLDALARAHGTVSSMHPRLPQEGRAPWHAWARWAVTAPRARAVVHAHLPWPDRLGPALLAAGARPMVVTFHLLPEGDAWPRDRLLGLDARAVIRLAARRPRTAWVALSHRDAARLRALGIDPVVVRNAPPAPATTTSPVAFPDGVLRLASVGRLDPQKGFDVMLDALAHPSLRDGAWRWAIAGDGPARESIAAQRDRLGLGGRVTLLGRRPAADLLARADVLLAPSRAEGMPLAPMEAMEAGVLVVASRIAPHLELLGDSPALLPEDRARWPERLAALFADVSARDALRLAQRAVLGDDPRANLWRAYASLYRAVSEPR